MTARVLILSLFLLTGCLDDKDKNNQKIFELEQKLTALEGKTSFSRYQIVMHPQYPAYIYLVDTQKGRIWQRDIDKDSIGNHVWYEETIIDGSQEIGTTINDYVELLRAMNKNAVKQK